MGTIAVVLVLLIVAMAFQLISYFVWGNWKLGLVKRADALMLWCVMFAIADGIERALAGKPLLRYRGGDQADVSYYDIVKDKECPSLVRGIGGKG